MKTHSIFAIRHQRPIYLFLGLCFNLLVLAPAVYAATPEIYTPSQVAWLVLLGGVTLALSIYLFVVMFQPERF